MMPTATIMGLPERVWAKLTLRDCGYETPCLIWGGTIASNGYGVVDIGGRQHKVHRLVYEAANGPMPEINGKRAVSDHLCRVRACARPDHIEPVTDKTNVLRGVSFAAVNAAKTECDNGHEFTESNTRIDASGQRVCLECKKDRNRKYDAVRTPARKAARQAARAERPQKPVKPPRQLAPCGTLAARLRHIRHGEPIDQACRDAHNERMRQWRAEHPRRAA